MAIRMIAGISARSRSRAMARPPRGAATGSGASPASALSTSDIVSDMVEVDPFHRGHQLVVAPPPAELPHEPALEQHQHPVAGPQILELVRDDQHRGAVRAD